MDDIGIGSIVLSVAFSWVIGLTPPLLIRLVFLREPIGHWLAVGICSLFWVFNFVLSSTIGGTSGRHGALLLVALAAYWILRTSFSPRISWTRRSPRVQEEPKTVTDSSAPVGAAARVEGPVGDEQLYARAFEELNSGQTVTGLWAKCFAETGGEENKAKAKYLATRTARLKAEHQMRSLELAKEARACEEAARIVAEEKYERAADSVRRSDAETWSVNCATMEECVAFLSVAAYSVERTDAGFKVQPTAELGSPTVLKDLPEVRLFIQKNIAGTA